jgi:hypothetical protein
VIKRRKIPYAMIALGVLFAVAASNTVRAAESDWKAVEQALGKTGQM